MIEGSGSVFVRFLLHHLRFSKPLKKELRLKVNNFLLNFDNPLSIIEFPQFGPVKIFINSQTKKGILNSFVKMDRSLNITFIRKQGHNRLESSRLYGICFFIIQKKITPEARAAIKALL